MNSLPDVEISSVRVPVELIGKPLKDFYTWAVSKGVKYIITGKGDIIKSLSHKFIKLGEFGQTLTVSLGNNNNNNLLLLAVAVATYLIIKK